MGREKVIALFKKLIYEAGLGKQYKALYGAVIGYGLINSWANEDEAEVKKCINELIDNWKNEYL